MELVKNAIKRSAVQPPTSSPRAALASCAVCGGFGWISRDGEHGLRRCDCARHEIRERLLKKIPPRYRSNTLASALADPARHPLQSQILSELRAHPADSFLFFGKHDTGKTFFGYLLYRAAVEADRSAVAINCFDLLSQFRDYEFDRERLPDIAPADLETDSPCFVFLDELDKPKPTEYAGGLMLQLVEKIYSYNHQLVITSNKSPDELLDHWNRENDTYGASMLRRIRQLENATEINLS